MRYLRIDVSPWPSDPLPWWARLLQKIIPAANPDLESLYPETSYWWVEIDDDGRPKREIGFNAEDEPIVLGPLGRNFGFLVDSADDLRGVGAESSDAAERFQIEWARLLPRFSSIADSSDE